MKAILLFLAGASASLAFAALARDHQNPNPPEGEYNEYHRFVFYAVLEGCYEDGLTAGDIDLIIPPDEHGGRSMSTNFVYTCPLCHPTFEAFRLYGSRKYFYGQKATRYDTFGQGLDDELKAQLRGTANERRTAIQGLISRWVERRADLLRMDKAERAGLGLAMKEMKKKGEEAMQRFQQGGNGDYYAEAYKDWKACPICDGAAGAKMGVE
jgi:hypothetical protein